MKKLLLLMLGVLIALPTMARDFTYTYAGQTINYTVVDEDAKTCKTARTNVSGDLTLPSNPKDGNIEYTLVEIGSYAFLNCTGLTSVSIPNSVTSICDFAFNECSSLTSVIIGNSVTSIGVEAFRWCSGLTSVSIPNSVTGIGYSAFYDCSSLTSVTYLAKEPIAFMTYFFNNETYQNATLNYLKEAEEKIASTEPWSKFIKRTPLSNVARDFQYTYAGQTITYTVIDEAAKTCMTKRGVWPTAGNNVYGNLILPSNPKDGDTEYTLVEIGSYAFSDCTGLTSVTIPNSVTTIGNKAFYECTGLTSVTIPNSVTEIGGLRVPPLQRPDISLHPKLCNQNWRICFR